MASLSNERYLRVAKQSALLLTWLGVFEVILLYSFGDLTQDALSSFICFFIFSAAELATLREQSKKIALNNTISSFSKLGACFYLVVMAVLLVMAVAESV